MRWLLLPALACSSCLALAQSPPTPKKVPQVTELHGRTLTDNYFWMRNREDKDLMPHLKAEAAYTQQATAHLKPLREKLFKEIVGRIQEDDKDAPVFDQGYWYYTRTVKGKEYPLYCRRKGSLSAREEIILDANKLAKGHKFFEVGFTTVSPNGRILAYSYDTKGYREYQVAFRDLKTGKNLSDKPGKSLAFVWALDSKTYYLLTENEAKRWDKVWRHSLGSTKKQLIFEEKDPLFYTYAYASSDRTRLMIATSSKNTGEVRALSLSSPDSSLRMVRPRGQHRAEEADFRQGYYSLVTDDKGPNNRLIRLAENRLASQKWQDVVPVSSSVVLSGAALFKDFTVLQTRKGGFARLEILRGGKRTFIPTPEATGAVSLGDNPDRSLSTVRFQFESLARPRQVMEHNVKTGRQKVLKATPIKGHRPEDYIQQVVWATAKDGTKIPISTVRKKTTKLSPSTPLLLGAYGSYGAPSDPYFSNSRLSLLNRGVVYALAHIRGGGEFGLSWYEQGKMSRKMNTFTDFIACGDFLVAEGWTSHNKMAIQGGSAGGLLMGAVANLRPDLAQAVVAQVPFVDVINTMLDETIPLTTAEFVEWGNPKVKEEFEWMIAYSPYDNVAAKSYPHMLIEVGLNDSQVPYWEGAKWAAKLRDYSQSKSQILLKVNMDAGHGGASGRYSSLQEVAFTFSWILDRLGVRK